MPCDDVTETIRLRLDPGDRLADYELKKKTCGGAVGQRSLILEELRGRGVDELLALDVEAFHGARPDLSEEDEFFRLKHFFALRMALEALTGREPGGVGEACVVAAVVYDEEGLLFEGDIPLDVATERIRACGLCKGCGVKKRGPRD